jgi:hypothetical protein
MLQEEDRQELAKQVAKVMVFAMLDVSPKIDTVSAWLMGFTTGFLLLIFNNFDRALSVIKIGPTKTLIWLLVISTLAGLVQKYLSLVIQTHVHTQRAAQEKMAELANIHNGGPVTNPASYFREHADVDHLLTLFFSALPKWLAKRWRKSLENHKSDLSSNRTYFYCMGWQSGTWVVQLLCALSAVVVILVSL